MFWTGELIAKTAPVRRRAVPAYAPHVDRGMAAYLGLAIGDALGATVEFLTPNEIRHQIGLHCDITGGGWLRLKAGKVTDDTTMSLALGESIIAKGRVDALAAAEAFDAWMRAKPVDIGNTVRRNLIAFRQTGNPEAPASEHDAGNGAAMRVLPVALACYGQPEKTTIFANRAQAHVTHHNALSDAACETLIFMVQDFLAGRDPVDVERQRAGKLVSDFPVFAYDKRLRENPSGFVVDTMQAVLQSFFATETFEDCLIDVVNRGGDADTTGAIAGMLAGARYGMDSIPKRWSNALDASIRAQCPAQALELLAPQVS
ncbi:MAG: ADP-ribosyl-[dinitrogen reductase] hydrolase [Gammaproteobacteria bacterium]|nr:ADP-ribosyl-[dinitrogen reductase] hydrolase [Gammaproteobacteria bacterium]MBU1602753.1 ADP-ribosyl-[dinitrogen reductase] hydrolase [Gammaproteobacteria bacterium]MBU2432425.1 ADP-ribosyl-[dinitrogen reductase] hydrolase [Gammaproteobacteria bacterium]MBU2449085.1 ADP-ribosyl-[dinitrogen reductase] hydrolase [Gammaproteobacteria bacterium]